MVEHFLVGFGALAVAILVWVWWRGRRNPLDEIASLYGMKRDRGEKDPAFKIRIGDRMAFTRRWEIGTPAYELARANGRSKLNRQLADRELRKP